MPVHIPYVRDLDFEYGKCVQVAPGIRRVIAKNPSAFTYYGTGTYIVGEGSVAIIDPGPKDHDHVQALLQATADETITHLVVTHTHMDHSPACAMMREHCDAPTYGFGRHGSGHDDDGIVVEEGGDMEFDPDIVVDHLDVVEGDGWSLRCIHTPGHTSNHVCYAYDQEKMLFSGDHVMGWSTSVISPPDGDMKSYMSSLRILLSEEFQAYWPTHGPPITDPLPHVSAFIRHRQERESQIREQLSMGVRTIPEMIPSMYGNVDVRLHPAAARSVYAAVVYLVSKGEVLVDGPLKEDAEFRLAEP